MAVLALLPASMSPVGNARQARNDATQTFVAAVPRPLEEIAVTAPFPAHQVAVIDGANRDATLEAIGGEEVEREARSDEELQEAGSDEELQEDDELADLETRRAVFAAMSPPMFRSGPPVEVSLDEMLETARKLLGVSYVWGGTSTSGMDCSAYVSAVWRVPGRTTETLPNVAFRISKDQLRAGDALNLTAQEDETGYGHVRLFMAWASADHTRIWVYEQTPPRATFHEIAYDPRYTPLRRMSFVADEVAQLAPARGMPGAFTPNAGEGGPYFNKLADTPEFQAKHGPPSRKPPVESAEVTRGSIENVELVAGNVVIAEIPRSEPEFVEGDLSVEAPTQAPPVPTASGAKPTVTSTPRPTAKPGATAPKPTPTKTPVPKATPKSAASAASRASATPVPTQTLAQPTASAIAGTPDSTDE
jgi:hypothetical protein